MKLSELDLTVEHTAGKKIPNVDALSHHVGAVLHDKNLRRGRPRRADKRQVLSKSQSRDLPE